LEGWAYLPTGLEKVANCATHLPFIPVSVYLAVNLINKTRTPTELLVAAVYGIALISLFGASSAYHFCALFPTKSRFHDLLHFFDRLVIFVFIAASYTPWLVLREFEMDIGLLMLKAIWTTALCGAVYQYFCRKKWRLLSLIFYLTIGVLPAISVAYIKDFSGLRIVALGGLTYITGTIFFKMDGVIPMAHAIWHCFVALAAYIHFSAIDRYLYSPLI
uniref:PAQR8 protein n=1 Tax=Hydatigena taeniaeformis TaxID=6205 RepID=A0A0R3WJ27_HYDTA